MSFKDNLLNRFAFNKHVDQVTRKYGKVLLLNLLSQSKIDEDKLSTTMNTLIEERADQNISKVDYDFHRELAGDNFENI